MNSSFTNHCFLGVFCRGLELQVAAISDKNYHLIGLPEGYPVILENGNADACLLLLQGLLINERLLSTDSLS